MQLSLQIETLQLLHRKLLKVMAFLITQHLIDRFWSNVNVRDREVSTICWHWVGSTAAGYGSFWTGSKLIGAHRFSVILTGQEVLDHHFILHSCDNRLCVNPLHLTIGTALENNYDRIKKGRGLKSDLIFNRLKEEGRGRLSNQACQHIRILHNRDKVTSQRLAVMYDVPHKLILEVLKHKA